MNEKEFQVIPLYCKECNQPISKDEARYNAGHCDKCMDEMWRYYEEIENARLEAMAVNETARSNYFEDVMPGWRK